MPGSIGAGFWVVICCVVASLTAFHALTYLLWVYESRVHGRPGRRDPVLPMIVAWLGEGLALGVLVITWPFGLLPVRRTVPDAGEARPAVLVHGWGLNRASMALMAARLRRDGRNVYTVDYPSTGPEMDAKAGRVAEGLRRIARETGSSKLDVVAYGQGGVVVRAAARLDGTLALLGNVVTLGAPHRGTALAAFFRRPRFVQLRPGSHFLEHLEEDEALPGAAHVTTIESSFDAIVFPGQCAYWPGAFSIALDGVGHAGLLLSDRVYGLVRENLDFAAAGGAGARRAGA